MTGAFLPDHWNEIKVDMKPIGERMKKIKAYDSVGNQEEGEVAFHLILAR